MNYTVKNLSLFHLFTFKKVAFTLTHIETTKDNHKVAFTLAEVLITLAVIGVVAAVTLPSVVKNYQQKITLSKFRSALSIITRGFSKMAVDGEGDIRNLYGHWNDLRDYKNMGKHFKFIKTCLNYGQKPDCVPYTTYALDKKTPQANNNKYPGYYDHCGILANGMIMCWETGFSGHGRNLGPTLTVKVDLNGEAKPNANGHDIFWFYLLPNGSITYHGKFHPEDYCSTNYSHSYNGIRCSEWIMQNNNMNYPKTGF